MHDIRVKAGWSGVAAAQVVGLAALGVGGCGEPSSSAPASLSQALDASPVLSAELDVAPVVPVPQLPANLVQAAAGTDSTLVVWEAAVEGSGTDTDVYGARVSFDGELLDPIALRIAASPEPETAPRVAYNGSVWLVAWDVGSTTLSQHAARISSAGELLDPTGIPVHVGGTSQRLGGVASDGDGFLVTRAGSAGLVALTVGAEGTVAPTPLVLSATAASAGRVAFNGTHYLVAYGDETAREIRARRVTPAGTLPDAGPSVLHTLANNEYAESYALASNGSGWLVGAVGSVWTASTTTYSLRFRAVGSDGAPVGSLASASVTLPRVMSLDSLNGTYTVAYRDLYGVKLQHLSAGGVLQGADPTLVLADALDASSTVALTSDGTRHFLALTGVLVNEDDTEHFVYGARLTDELTALDDPPLAVGQLGNQQLRAAVASGGASYLTVWEDSRAGRTNLDLRASLLDADGTVLEPAGKALSLALGDQHHPAVAWGGSGFLAAWLDDRAARAIMFTGVTAAGAVVHTTGRALASAPNLDTAPGVAGIGDRYLVVWPSTTHVLGALVAPTLTPTVTATSPAYLDLASSAATVRAPAVAANGASYLVAFERSGDLYGVRVDADGVRLTTGNELVLSALAGVAEANVALGSNGTDFLAVWESGTAPALDLRGARVTADGTVLDVLPFDVCTLAGTQRAPRVAWDGASYVVTWEEADAAGVTTGVSAVGIDPSGPTATVLSAPLAIATGLHGTGRPQLAGGPPDATNHRSLLVYDRFDADPAALVGRVKARFLSDTELAPATGGTGGAPGTGGAGATGGTAAGGTGGTATGGTSGSGGTAAGGAATGGAGGAPEATGGTAGAPSTGGAAGAPATGGAPGTGGTSATAGAPAGGTDPSGGAAPTLACIPGDVEACPCPGGGESGVQACNEEGTAYGACTCPAAASGNSGDEGGCGCRVTSAAETPPAAAWLAALPLALLFRRRRPHPIQDRP